MLKVATKALEIADVQKKNIFGQVAVISHK